jgi:hypothetical protein
LVKGRFGGLLIVASVLLGTMGAGSVVASFFILASPGPHSLALATALSGLVVFVVALGLMAWARHVGPAAAQVLLAVHMGRVRGVRHLQRRGPR